MNEALLIILILITGITFFNLVKKVGISAPIAVSPLHPNGSVNYPENFGNIIYSGEPGNVNTYNNLWTITATTGANNNPVLNKITVLYHQCKNTKNSLAYKEIAGNDSQLNTDAAFIAADVCISSNISDVQYRYVLLEQQ